MKKALFFLAAIPCSLLVAAGYRWGGSGWLCWFGFVPLFIAIESLSLGQAFLWGWLFAGSAWCISVPWLAGAMQRSFRIPYHVAFGLYLGLCAAHGLSGGILAWASRRLAPRLSSLLGESPWAALAVVASAAMLALEGYFTGVFPFQLAQTQLFHLPTVQCAELFGSGAVVPLLFCANVGFYACWSAWRPKHPESVDLGRPEPMQFECSGQTFFRRLPYAFLAFAAALLLANEAYGRLRMRALDRIIAQETSQKRALRVAIIQPMLPARNIARREAMAAENLAVQDEMTRQALAEGPVDLILWPEATYGRRLYYAASEDGARRGENLSGLSVEEAWKRETPYPAALLLNAQSEATLWSGRKERFNSAFLLEPPGKLSGVVHKQLLFPFGEYVPFGRVFPFLNRVNPAVFHLTRGEPGRLLEMGSGKARIGVAICYEDMFREPARRFVLSGADLLVNVTNDVWFGGKVACEQHLQYSVLRAIENRRTMLRAVDVGVSGVVDPTGRVAARIPVGQKAYLISEAVPLKGLTLFSRIGGLLNALGLASLLLLLAFGRGRG
ncbi:MAG: apolipoprotein N-acyltransferase [Elusimicrobia bacterium]|nr:apolipoprotein N-acyltransferase [Elusimicrobiota bacterium]